MFQNATFNAICTDCLSCSFVSYRALAWKVYDHLRANQKNPRCLYAIFGDRKWTHTAPLDVLPLNGLRTIDICFNGNQHLKDFFQALSSRYLAKTLERLAISVPENYVEFGSQLEVVVSIDEEITVFSKLKELSLLNLRNLSASFVLLSRYVKFHRLLRLNVVGCFESDPFFSSLGEHVREKGSFL
jgi:hypothetical protein